MRKCNHLSPSYFKPRVVLFNPDTKWSPYGLAIGHDPWCNQKLSDENKRYHLAHTQLVCTISSKLRCRALSHPDGSEIEVFVQPPSSASIIILYQLSIPIRKVKNKTTRLMLAEHARNCSQAPVPSSIVNIRIRYQNTVHVYPNSVALVRRNLQTPSISGRIYEQSAWKYFPDSSASLNKSGSRLIRLNDDYEIKIAMSFASMILLGT